MTASSPAALDRLDRAIENIGGISPSTAAPELSYGLFDSFDHDELIARLQTLTDRILNALTTQPSIESVAGSRVRCRTAVGYTGSVNTVVQGERSEAETASHLLRMAETLELRLKLLRVISATARVGTSVSIAAANPLGIAGAVSAIRQLVSELEGVVPLLVGHLTDSIRSTLAR